MKMTTLLLLLACLSVSAGSVAQKVTLLQKNVKLEKVFKEIRKQTGYVFFYDTQVLERAKPVDIHVENVSVEEALQESLRGQPFDFSIEQKTITIFQKADHSLYRSQPSVEYTGTELLSPVSIINGTVRDEQRNPLVGVSVVVKGTNRGTSTAADGSFSIEANVGNVLEFTIVGYQKKSVTIGQSNNLSVVMEIEVFVANEVVVVGYGTEKKVNLTGAISTIDSKSLENRAITNIGQGLQGIIPNLNVTIGNGSLGKGASFNVRGYNSINGGEPLILVDGIPMDINLLQPTDIESITVLKDAASAAIYGARAAFGVILVTTRNGKGKAKIKVSSLVSTNSPTSKIKFIDTKDRIAFMNAAYQHSNGVNYYDDFVTDALMAHYNDPSQPSSVVYNLFPGIWYPVGNTDWQKILMNDSYPMQQHTASISGGSERLDYYTSFSYLYQRGLTNRDLFDEHYSRYNFMTNLNYKFNNWMSFGTKISINKGDKRFPPNDIGNLFPEGGTIYMEHQTPVQPLKDPNGHWATIGAVPNLAQMLSEGGYQNRRVTEMLLTGSLKINPIDHVTINMDYSFNNIGSNQMSYLALLPHYDVNGNVYTYYAGSNPSRVSRSHTDNALYVFNSYATYSNTFKSKHNFSAMVGFNQESGAYSAESAERRNLIINSIPYMNLAAGDQFANDGMSEYALRGIFSRIKYNFNNRYLLEFNGRYDGSSRFPKESRFAFFPSISGGWRIDNEGFFSNAKKYFDILKLRGSYGVLGNQSVSSFYPYISAMNAGEVSYLINGEKPMSVYPSGLVSPSLTWETVDQWNLGIDFSILNGKLNGTFDVYNRITKNMLTKSRTLPAVLAVAEPLTNAADLSNHGFDLQLNWTDTKGNFQYSLTALLSDFTGKITKYDNPAGLLADYYVGQSLGEIWGLTTGGIFQSNEEAAALDQNDISKRKRLAGDLWMVDLNGDRKITLGSQTLDNHGDLSVIGNNTPRYSFGLRGNFQWKGFDLDIFFQGVGKRDLWMTNLFYLSQYTGEWNAIQKVAMDYWTPDNPDAFFPSPAFRLTNDVTSVQTRFLQNASYIRLKQLNFGYVIPQKYTQRFGVNRLKIFFSGSNLWTGTKMIKISDPELPGPSAYPLFKSFSLGINIEL